MLQERYDKSLTILKRVSTARKDVDNWFEQKEREYHAYEKLGKSKEDIKKIQRIDQLKGLVFVCKDFVNVIAGKDQEPDLDDVNKILNNLKYNPVSKHPGVNIEAAQEQIEGLKGQETITAWRAKWNSLIDENKASYGILAAQALLSVFQKGLPYLCGFQAYSKAQQYLLEHLPASISFEALSLIVSLALGALSFKGIKYLPLIVNAFWRDYTSPNGRREWKEFIHLKIIPWVLLLCSQTNSMILLAIFLLIG